MLGKHKTRTVNDELVQPLRIYKVKSFSPTLPAGKNQIVQHSSTSSPFLWVHGT